MSRRCSIVLTQKKNPIKSTLNLIGLCRRSIFVATPLAGLAVYAALWLVVARHVAIQFWRPVALLATVLPVAALAQSLSPAVRARFRRVVSQRPLSALSVFFFMLAFHLACPTPSPAKLIIRRGPLRVRAIGRSTALPPSMRGRRCSLCGPFLLFCRPQHGPAPMSICLGRIGADVRV